MNKKVIFLDIDGTLTEPGCNIPPQSALDAIKKAQKNGHKVFLCTGRNLAMLKPLLQYDFDGAVGSAGGYVFYKDKVLYNQPMTEDQRVRLVDMLQRNQIHCTLECEDGTYTDPSVYEMFATKQGHNSEFLRWRRQLEENLSMEPIDNYKGQLVYKITLIASDRKNYEEPLRLLGDEFRFVLQEADDTETINGEVSARGFDKGTGVLQVCDYLGIPVEDSIGYGDSMNDLEMLKTVGLSICMEDGAEAMKQIADELCPSVTDDGIYKSFVKHGLISE